MKKVLLFALLAIFTTVSFAAKKEKVNIPQNLKKSVVIKKNYKEVKHVTATYIQSSCGDWWYCSWCDIESIQDPLYIKIRQAIDGACGTDIQQITIE